MSYPCATVGCMNIITDARKTNRLYCKDCQLRKKREKNKLYKRNKNVLKGLP